MNFLANLLTTLSLVFGFISIIASLEGQFTFACWAIIISVIFDGLDGQVARRNPVPSEFGKELDSLVDVISFGVAPAILGYIFVYRKFHLWATVALFAYLFCSVMRLAKYNITARDELKNYFYGLPTTMSGGVLASFILLHRKYTNLAPPVIFLLLVLALALLMVSKVKYPNLDAAKELFTKSIWTILAVIVLVAGAVAGFYWVTGIILPEVAVFALFAIYLYFAPFMVKFLSKPR